MNHSNQSFLDIILVDSRDALEIIQTLDPLVCAVHIGCQLTSLRGIFSVKWVVLQVVVLNGWFGMLTDGWPRPLCCLVGWMLAWVDSDGV